MALATRLAALLALALPLAPSAQVAPAVRTVTDVSGADSLAGDRVPTLAATPLPDGVEIRVDGRVDEEAWALAEVATGFVQLEPTPGAPATERTEARVLYGRSALYVAVTCHVRDPATLVRRLGRRDDIPVSDRVVVEIGSPADGRTGYSFGVTLAGSQHDVLLFDDTREDASWDSVWESAVAPLPRATDGSGGYAVEVRIPYSQLRYDAASEAPWGIEFQRDIAATGERSYWAPIRPDREGYVSQFGLLTGLRGLRPPRRVEVVPYAATRLTRADGDAADPFYDANDLAPTAGLDARVGLTSGLTLTATVNPDFGQVEADPAVVNLSQFEVFFEERRPFFVEGTDVFAFGATRGPTAADRPDLFYSRRIGGQPSSFRALYADTAVVWLDSPERTTIAAAGKLSGQVGGWTVGLLNASTTGEEARFVDPAGARRALPVAPFTNFLVARARRATAGGRRTVGLFASSVVRDSRADAFAARLPGTATVGGVDGEIVTAGRRWTLSGVAVGSVVSGERSVVQALQRAPQRYYQRPGAGYVAVDTSATTLAGYRAEASLARTAGSTWRGGLTLGATSPGFETNDLGFQQRADLLSADASVEYRIPRPRAAWLNFALYQLYTSQAFNYGLNQIGATFGGQARLRYSGLWETQLIGVVRPLVSNDRLTRGGPRALRPADANLTFYTGTNRARRLAASLSVAARREFAHNHRDVGREWTVRFRPTLYVQPTDALSLAIEPVWTSSYNTDQFLGTRAAPGLSVGGTRYLFSDTRIESLAAGLRADWAFTPRVTLQFVLVPQVDAVRYSAFRELASGGTYDFVRYGTTRGTLTPVAVADDGTETPAPAGVAPDRYRVDPGDGGATFVLPNFDFTNLSLRGNAVLRWEWRPGSALFVVWQQVRDENTPFDGLGVLSDLPDAFGATAQNVFLVKASYWFGL